MVPFEEDLSSLLEGFVIARHEKNILPFGVPFIGVYTTGLVPENSSAFSGGALGSEKDLYGNEGLFRGGYNELARSRKLSSRIWSRCTST